MLPHPSPANILWPRPSPGWRFDFPSALIGAALALLLVGLAYRFRAQLRREWEEARDRVLRLYKLFQAGAEERYCRAVTRLARSLATPYPPPLERVFVEPRLAVPLPLPETTEKLEETLEAVPETHRVVPLGELEGEHSRLLFVAPDGGGKTALLAHIARACARQQESPGVVPPPMQGRTPLYVFLPAVAWGDEAAGEPAGEPADGIESLVAAASVAVGKGNALAPVLRQRLTDGEAVVLLDGWDALSQAERERAAAWVGDLAASLPGNLWIVAVGERGYAPLVEREFLPLHLARWDARQVREFARRWADTHQPDELEPPLDREELDAILQERARLGDSPLELALRAFVYLADRRVPTGRAPLFDRALEVLLSPIEPVWVPEVCKAAMERLALRLLREGRVTAGREEVEAEIKSLLPPTEENPARAAAVAFRALTGEHGLIRRLGSDRYVFVHHEWQAYLATRRLVAEADGEILQEHLEDPRWAAVLLFYAEMGNIGPLVSRWLRAPDDLLHTRLRTLSAWIKAAPPDAAWRNGAMAVLARSFLAAKTSHERRLLAQVLADTRSPGISYFFKQALQHADADVRAAAVTGFVRVMGEADFPALDPLFRDGDFDVVETTVRSLADVGTTAAVRLLERILFSGDETLAPLAAETLARCDEQCRSVLDEAATADDPLVRRAAIFGLVKIGARGRLEQLAREDDQWIVRTGAQAALDELEAVEKSPPLVSPPRVEELPWLISWAAALGMGVGTGDAAQRMLLRALKEGEPAVRWLAARVLAQVGRAEAVEPLRAALSDAEPLVAEAAWEALTAIVRRYDLRVG